MRSILCSVFCLLCSALLAAQTSQAPISRELPVKRVVLFKNGVGFFEHVGSVRGNASVGIAFTSGQLNDVLKSLTVFDLNGGRISGVAYGTSAPVARQLGELPFPMDEKPTLAGLLASLRGSRIEVKTGGLLASGRLLSVEQKTRIAAGVASQEVDYVSLMSAGGELRTIELSPSSSVRLLEPGLTGRLDHYLDLIASEREANARTMVISDEGSGDRNLYVSYISEVPVWKSTYRLVLSGKPEKESLLQGWAIVDNVVGEDWNNVELSLVAGAPQSFNQNLSQPYYAQRPLIGLPETVSTTPQTYEATLETGAPVLSGNVTDPSGAAVSGALVKVFDANDNMIAQAAANATGAYEIASLPEGAVHLRVEAPGFTAIEINGVTVSANKRLQENARLQVGSTAQTIVVDGSAPRERTGSGKALGSGTALGASAGLRYGDALGVGSGNGTGGGVYRVAAAQAVFDPAALSQTLGDLFEYKLKAPITILKNRSALVPIAQAPVTVEKVSVWNDRNTLPRPQRAVWITNTTGLTLDGGSVSVIENETFTGEGIFDPIRPGEKRLLSFATDLAVNASSRAGSEDQRVFRVLISKGMMKQEIETREKKVYTFRNEDTTPRTIVVEHPVRSGYQLRSEPQPVETTAAWMRFRLDVAAKQTASLVVEEARPTESQFILTNLSSDQVALFVGQRSIDNAIQQAFQQILSEKDAIAVLQSQKGARDGEAQRIFDDQQRLRENIKALKGTPEEKPLLERYTEQLNRQETRSAVLSAETSELNARIDAANKTLDENIQKLTFDVKL